MEIQYANLFDIYKHSIGISPCFSDHRSYSVDVLYLEDGNAYRLVLKNERATVFPKKKLF